MRQIKEHEIKAGEEIEAPFDHYIYPNHGSVWPMIGDKQVISTLEREQKRWNCVGGSDGGVKKVWSVWFHQT